MSNSQRTSQRLDAFCLALNFFLSREVRELVRRTGGAERDRTDDLLLAKQALSQLSYGPINGPRAHIGSELRARKVGGPGKI
jgi:hypothetical protein